MLGAGSGWVLARPSSALIPMLALATALSAFSFVDDLRGLSRLLRFGMQIVTSVALIWLMQPLSGGAGCAALALIALVWMTNAFNFMDGADGLAGGMAIFGFGIYALAAFQGGMMALATTAACLVGASLGFLWFNFHPARIFMGDAGSVPLGFLAAAMGIHGWQSGLWPIAFPVLVFSPFIVDASLTLVNRILRREKFWQPHRDHYYQRLVRMGVGHRNTALLAYAMMLACGGSAWLVRESPAPVQMAVLIGWTLAYACLAYLIDRAWSEHSKGHPSA